MEWYYWVLITYSSIVFLSVASSLDAGDFKGFNLFRFIAFFVCVFLFGFFITPFLWVTSLTSFLTYETLSYETFTIHELTEENKTTLRELGFEQGYFVTKENCDYSGFRLRGDYNIRVLYNGRVAVGYIYHLNKHQKMMIDIIKNLPDESERKEEKEENKND